MKAKLRQFLIGCEAEIPDDEIALRGRGILGRVDARKYEPRDEKKKDSEHGSGSPMQRLFGWRGRCLIIAPLSEPGKEPQDAVMLLLHTPPVLAVLESFSVSGGPRHADAGG
jgi:hypothetical protein